MHTISPQQRRARPLALVVSDSGLERHRLPRRLRRAGFEVTGAVAARDAPDAIARADHDVVVWTGDARDPIARHALRRTDPAPAIVLVVEDDAVPGVISAALDAGFADAVRAGAAAGEVVARARAAATRHAQARALRAEAEAFRELAEGGRDLLARQGPDGTIRYASGAARAILGVDPAVLVGRRVPDLEPSVDQDASAGPRVHRTRRQDGTWVWMETSTRVIHDPSGRVREVHTDSRDVSRRVQAEDERAAITRVTAAVARGGSFAGIAELVAREALALLRAEHAAVLRLHDDEGLVVAAAGAGPGAGERLALVTAGEEATLAPVVVGGRPWGALMARGGDPVAGARSWTEPLMALAPLLSLAVSNSRSRERLVALASTDPLTGLANHGAFHRRLDEDCARAERAGTPLSLVMIDIDHFKRVNDGHGHQVGDEVLREVARRLRECARRGDVTGRVGGEELAWLLPGTALAPGMEAAERLRRRIVDEPFAVVGRLTASFGVAELVDGMGPSELARQADQALYRAKESGRNTCVAAGGGESSLTAARSV